MTDPKLCTVCDLPITDKGTKYCPECRQWMKDVDSSKGKAKPVKGKSGANDAQ